MLASRLALAAVAIVVCLWFALGVRQAHDTAAAQAALSHPASLTAAEVARVNGLLRGARTLNPDRTVAQLQAQLDGLAGDPRRAAAVVEGVVAAEPQNIGAWLLLELETDGRNAALNREAGLRVRELAPPVPSP